MCLDSGQQSLSVEARLCCAASAAIMTFIGLGAKLLLRGVNTTVVHGQQHLVKGEGASHHGDQRSFLL